jgi:uncharacterized repeat protein (TIGR02543 family)
MTISRFTSLLCATIFISARTKIKQSVLFLLSFTLLALGPIIFPISVQARQNLTKDALFTEVTPTMPAPSTDATLRSRRVLIDPVKLTGRQRRATKPSTITVNLFDDVFVKITPKKSYSNPSGSRTWIGKVESIPHSIAIFIIRDKAVYGTVVLPNIGRFTIRPNPDGTHLIEQIKDDATLSGEDDTRIPDKSLYSPQGYIVSSPAVAVDISNDDGSIIDVYVVYDQDSSGGSVAAADAQSYAELFIAYTNQAYENSNINQRVWLVGSVDGYDHTDIDVASLDADLDAATDGTLIGMHAKRDEYHADLVMFFTPYTASSCSGLAHLQTQNDNIGWNTNGFAAMEACYYGESVFAHELGHTMGSRHDWYMDNGITPSTIAHGHIDTSNNFRTIMSYSNRCVELGTSCPTIPYFSNPTINYSSVTTGVVSGTNASCAVGDPSPVTECDADNTTNFNTKALTTSRFRDSRLTWTGAMSSDWTTAGNWSIDEGAPGATTAVNHVPRSFDNVYIPSGLSTYPSISGTATVRELAIEDGATLEMTAGTLTVGWRWTDNGGFNTTGGTVVFSGPIGVTVSSASSFGDVQIGSGSDTSVVTLGNDLDIDGNLQISAGTSFDPGGFTINVAGDWTEADATGFIAGTSTVIFDGSSQSISKVTSISVLNEDFSAYDSSCCTSVKPDGWASSDGLYYQGDLVDTGDGAANRWRNESDGYLYTPALSLQTGAVYQLQYDVAIRQNFTSGENDGLLSSQTVSVHLGTAQNSADMTTTLSAESSESSTSYQTRTISNITVASSGTYYIGFRAQQTGNDYTSFDDISLTGFGSISFYNLQVASGTTTFGGDVVVSNTLQTDSGATADFSTHAVTVEGTVTNNGSIKQTKTVANSTTTEFARIKDAAGSTDKYFGVKMIPSTGSMGTTTVEVMGNQVCAASGPPATGINRCYVVTPGSNQTADVTFYYRSTESNGNTTPDVYLETGGSWTVQTTSTHGGSGDAVWATGSSLTGYGIFSLSEDLTTYTVTYNANVATSGSVPSNQTKIPGIDLTLANNTGNLAKTGYTFTGWNTAANGSGTDYAVGATYNMDAAVTLYAKWTPLLTYTVSYNANGATSGTVPSDQTKTEGIDLTLANNTGNLEKIDYTFAGWNTATNGSGTDYAEGATYSFDTDATIYAKWTSTVDKEGAGFWNLILPAILSGR